MSSKAASGDPRAWGKQFQLILHKSPYYLLLDPCPAEHMCLAVCLLFMLTSVHCVPFGLQLQEYGVYGYVLLPPHGILAFLR